MKRLLILMCLILIITCLSAEYIIRDSESNTKFGEYEYLQGGILYRFDFKQVEIITERDTAFMWRYKEIWLPESINKEQMERIIKTEKIEKKAMSGNLEIWKKNTIKPNHKLKMRSEI